MKKNLILSAFIFICILASCYLLPSGSFTNPAENRKKRNAPEDFNHSVERIIDGINAEFFHLNKVYILPVDDSPAPAPDSNNFTENSYEDETISVKCWRERSTIPGTNAVLNFAEVTIAHPSQLRTAFAGGKYGLQNRYKASLMAKQNNAVIAINADLYNFRSNGIIIRQGTLYREKAIGWDVLFIDAEGDFHIVKDQEAIKEKFYQNNEIYNSLNFGPALVIDGEAIHYSSLKNVVNADIFSHQPRTCIGQLGRLHYLLCTVDGRSETSSGVSTNELALIMKEKGCRNAYNLDGGQSSTMIFNNAVYNQISNGGERPLSDIIYFGTALPQNGGKTE